MAYWCKNLRKGFKENPATKKKEYDWKLHETWEDYPFPDYKVKHTYCRIAFDDSGKTFYYRTRNPELKVGDMVYVPVGYKYEQRIGKIVSMNHRIYFRCYSKKQGNPGKKHLFCYGCARRRQNLGWT